MKNTTHCTATKEEVYDYYITQDHTMAETSRRFNCTPDAMKGFLDRNGIPHKQGKTKTFLKASYEEVYDYYVKENHSEKETYEYFKCGITALENYLSRNGIKKDRSQVGNITSKVKQSLKEERFTNLLSRVNKDEFIEDLSSGLIKVKDMQLKYGLTYEEYSYLKKIYQASKKTALSSSSIQLLNNYSKEEVERFYVEEDHSLEESLDHFHIGRDAFLNVLNILDIQKHIKIKDIVADIKEEDFKNKLTQNLSIGEICQYFNIDYFQLFSLIDYFNIEDKDIRINKKTSIPEGMFEAILKSKGVEDFITQFHLDKYYYDFKIGNNLIEINPSYTHNSTLGFRGLLSPLSADYHSSKSKVAEKYGYRCIHIWDWDDPEKIISLIKNRPTLYARNCEVREISESESSGFLNLNHIQGNARCSIRLGMFYEGTLISVMTFGKPRYNKKYQYELIRYCSTHNVLGGPQKIFKHFQSIYHPSSVISYCDLSKFQGKTYSDLGFSLLRVSKPSKHWFKEKGKQHITDNLLRQRGFDQLFGSSYGKGSSNEELMLQNGFVEIYDCGQATYIWNN